MVLLNMFANLNKYFISLLVLTITSCGATLAKETKIAVLAGGCFWCMEPPFDSLEGVIDTVVGYTGGSEINPTYEMVSAGKTGHTEAIQIEYDPSILDYKTILDIFWVNIDPEAQNRQFCDVGSQYRSGIFYMTREEKETAINSRDELLKKGIVENIHTEISELNEFYRAEEYHQNYYQKNSVKYKSYRYFCGRDKRLNEIWKNKK